MSFCGANRDTPAASGDLCKTPQPPPPPSGGLLLPWLLTGGHVCRWYLVNRDLSEQPGICQSGDPLGGGDGKLSFQRSPASADMTTQDYWLLLSQRSVPNRFLHVDAH